MTEQVGAVEPVEISAGRLHLRPPSVADVAGMVEIFRDPDVQRWNPGPDPEDENAVREWCEGAGDWSRGGHASFSVLDSASGLLLGTVAVHRIDPRSGDAEIGYRVAPAARGRRVASDAVSAASRWAFGALEVVRIELLHAVGHEASCRVAQNAGYRLEGTKRQSYVYGVGVRYDEHLHARLATDHEPVAT